MKQQQKNDLEIFNAALEIPGQKDRAAFLDHSCAGDTALREKIDSLLSAYENGSDTFDNVSIKASHRIGVAAGDLDPSEQIGRYHLIEKLGEGGCGVVYLAEQETPVRRRVAVKIVKAGMDTRSVIARFEAERQALAIMDHPNIARVYDAGTTRNGRPYFVMELVHGVRITDYCAQNKLPIRERLKLFLQVCEAVQHAHQKGIIHRDLKPSNILVTDRNGAPAAQVIDFGIAKAIAGKLTDHSLHTAIHQLIGTPAYMSPEQALITSDDIDTRSDIYSLGILLYELLTGKPPFDNHELLTAGLDEMRRIIREQEPERPLTRLRRSQAGFPAMALSTDLDWIVMKCLEKDRSRRYETANGLAADIQRHLNHEPVVARPASAAYRLQRLVRRHRTASLAVTFVFLAVFLGVAVSTWALVRERAARLREQTALEDANQLLSAALGFVDQVVTNVAPEIRLVAGAAKAQEKLLETGLSFVQRLRESSGNNPGARVALTRLLLYISERQNPGEPNTIGGYETALKRAEEALQLLGTETPQLSEAERLALLYQGKFAIVSCLYGLARWDEGILRSKEIEPLLDQLERFPERARQARRNRMLIRINSGWATYLAGRHREALENYVLPLLGSDWARSITNDSEKNELHILFVAHDNAYSAYGLLKDFTNMLPHVDESLRIAELLARRHPEDVFYLDATAQCRAWRGYALVRTGSIEPGFSALSKAREEVEARAEKEQSSEAFRRNRVIIIALHALAFAGWSQDTSASLADRGQRLAQGEKHLAEAEEISQTIKSKTGALPAARTEVAAARAMLRALEERQP